jgi:hypothetical protein
MVAAANTTRSVVEKPQELALDSAQASAGKPKPTGGARITRPTQVVKTAVPITTTSTVLAAAQVTVVKERAEVVSREAGPRITKPTVLQENETNSSKAASAHVKKIEQTALNRIQKIKEGLANEKKTIPAATAIASTTQANSVSATKKIKPVPGLNFYKKLN